MRRRYGLGACLLPAAARIGVAGSTALVAWCWAVSGLAAEPAFRDFPLVVYCEYKGITSAYYFSQLEGEQAVYLTPDRQAGMITIDGTAQRVGGDRPGNCLDKTLEELRGAGQAFDLPR